MINAALNPLADPAFLSILEPDELESLVSGEVDSEAILTGRAHVHDMCPTGPVGDAFYRSWARYMSIIGPVGSAKTLLAVEKCGDIAADMPVNRAGFRDSRIAVVRNFEADLLRSTMPDWERVMGTRGKWLSKNTPIQYEIDYPGDDGIRVHCLVDFVAFDDPRAAAKKIKGLPLTAMWVDEAVEMDHSILMELFARLGRYPHKSDLPPEAHDFWRGAVLSSNPPPEDHWLYQVHEMPTEDQIGHWLTFNQPGGLILDPATKRWVENPLAENLESLPRGYYLEQLAIAPSPGFIRTRLGGLYGVDMAGKAVWDAYNPVLHETEEHDFIPGDQVYAGIDYGRSPAVVLGQRRDGGYVIFDEYVMRDSAATDLAMNLKLYLAKNYRLRPHQIDAWDDPAGQNKHETSNSTAHQLVQSAGFNVVPSPIANTDLDGRLKAVVDPMTRIGGGGLPALLIHKRCRILRRAAAGAYCYREMKIAGEKRYTEKPDKTHPWSDVADALQCLCAGLGEGCAYDQTAMARRRRRSAPTTRYVR